MQDFTDSYCERCGTRYTFGPPTAKGPSLATARVLARGLKHFVMNDSSTIEDAMTAARVDEEQTEATRINEEFHRTFSFCMTCRQYACDKCWNPNQGACLSCAPLWDTEPVAPEDHLIIRTPSRRSQAPSPVEAAPDPSILDMAISERRATRRDQKAAKQLQARSESWKTQDDGWSLWPEEQPAAPASKGRDLNLTPDELLLVQSELDTPPYQEPDELRPPKRAPRGTGKRSAAQPEQTSPAAPSDFDLVGSLREPVTLDNPPEPAQQPPAEAHRGPALGRLLGHREPAPEANQAEAAAPPAKPARAARGKGHGAAESAEPWPQPTPWSARPIVRHDWWAESEPESPPAVAGAAGSAQAPWVAEPVPAELPPAPETPPSVRPARSTRQPVQAGQPEFGQSPAAWLAAARRSPEAHPEPEQQPEPTVPAQPREAPPPQAPPASPDAWVASTGARDRRPVWPPVGARLPAPPTEKQIPWPTADQTSVAASVAARDQLERADQDEAAQVAALWAESAQRVFDRGSVRACYHCSLPLSTHARFCRRCGTDQQG